MTARRRKHDDAATQARGFRHLNIQVQPERASALDLARLHEAVESLARDRTLVAGFATKEGEDEGPYVNFTFAAKDAALLWRRIREALLEAPTIGPDVARSSIIICQGDHGWDDYLLLHHFDPALPLDDLARQ